MTKSFSPIYFNTELLEDGKVSAVNKFTSILFPNLGSSILDILLDLEKNSKKIIASATPEEINCLIKELEGVTIEIQYNVKSDGKELMKLPINISPSEVLKNAKLVEKKETRYDNKMQDNLNNIISSVMGGLGLGGNIKGVIEGFLQNFMSGQAELPDMVKELLGLGVVKKDGHLADGISIEDVLSGKYAKQFKNVLPEQLINEALLIKDSMETFYNLEEEKYKTIINEKLREKGILEITLGEIKLK